MDTFDYSKKMMAITSSASIEIKRLADEMKQTNPSLVDLVLGEPCFDTDKDICEIAYQSMLQGDTHYVTGKGRLALREKLCERYRVEYEQLTSNDIIITPGAKFAIYMCTQALLNDGDSIMIFDPSWVSYEQIIRACGGNCIHITLREEDNYCMNLDLLNQYYQPTVKAIIVNNPNNPTGRILSNEEMKMIVEFAIAHNIYIIADEIYEAIDFHNSFKSFMKYFFEYEKIVIINGFSKSLAMTGWRIGYCVATGTIMELLSKLYSHTITGIPGFVQEAAYYALDRKDIVMDMTRFYYENIRYFSSKIERIPGLTCYLPDGTFYLWIKLDKEVYEFEDAARYLLEQGGIVGVSGKEYGEIFTDYVRLSVATSKENIEKAIYNLEKMYQNKGGKK